MSQELSLHQRRRLPTRSELEGIPWLGLLQGEAHERALAALVVGDAQAGDYVCRLGRPVTYWFGVVQGLLKMNTDTVDGATSSSSSRHAGSNLLRGKRKSANSWVSAMRPTRSCSLTS